MHGFILGRGENIVREEDNVHYHGGYSKIGRPMRGKLVVTNKRFAFVEQEVVESGFLKKKKEIRNVGIRINIPVENVIGANIETRERKKGTLNEPPTLFSKEKYNVLIVSIEMPEGIENPIFEVSEPDVWMKVLERLIGGETLR